MLGFTPNRKNSFRISLSLLQILIFFFQYLIIYTREKIYANNNKPRVRTFSKIANFCQRYVAFAVAFTHAYINLFTDWTRSHRLFSRPKNRLSPVSISADFLFSSLSRFSSLLGDRNLIIINLWIQPNTYLLFIGILFSDERFFPL